MKIENVFGISDEEFWSDPWRTRKAVQRPLLQKNQDGLLLGTPCTVALNQHSTFPAALIRVAGPATLGKIPSRPSMVITAFDLGTNELRAQLALSDTRRLRANSAPVKSAGGKDSFSEDASAMMSEGHSIDL